MAQWNKNRQDYLNQERSLFEVYNIADHWGNQTDWRPQFTNNNRFKVSPYQTVFFNTFQYGKETDVWDERVVGVGTATYANSAFIQANAAIAVKPFQNQSHHRLSYTTTTSWALKAVKWTSRNGCGESMKAALAAKKC